MGNEKTEFTRYSLEKATGLTVGQSEWWIKDLRHKGIIKKTTRCEYVYGKGQNRAIYRYIGDGQSQ